MGASGSSEEVKSAWRGKKYEVDSDEERDGRIFKPTETIAWIIGCG